MDAKEYLHVANSTVVQSLREAIYTAIDRIELIDIHDPIAAKLRRTVRDLEYGIETARQLIGGK